MFVSPSTRTPEFYQTEIAECGRHLFQTVPVVWLYLSRGFGFDSDGPLGWIVFKENPTLLSYFENQVVCVCVFWVGGFQEKPTTIQSNHQ